MDDRKDIDELIRMLDQSVANGSGHIKVTVNDPDHIEMESVEIVSKMDCDIGDTACKIPNLPMDDDDEF